MNLVSLRLSPYRPASTDCPRLWSRCLGYCPYRTGVGGQSSDCPISVPQLTRRRNQILTLPRRVNRVPSGTTVSWPCYVMTSGSDDAGDLRRHDGGTRTVDPEVVLQRDGMSPRRRKPSSDCLDPVYPLNTRLICVSVSVRFKLWRNKKSKDNNLKPYNKNHFKICFFNKKIPLLENWGSILLTKIFKVSFCTKLSKEILRTRNTTVLMPIISPRRTLLFHNILLDDSFKEIVYFTTLLPS